MPRRKIFKRPYCNHRYCTCRARLRPMHTYLGIPEPRTRDGHLYFCPGHLPGMSKLYQRYKAVEELGFFMSEQELKKVIELRESFQYWVKPQISYAADGHNHWLRTLYTCYRNKVSVRMMTAEQREAVDAEWERNNPTPDFWS